MAFDCQHSFCLVCPFMVDRACTAPETWIEINAGSDVARAMGEPEGYSCPKEEMAERQARYEEWLEARKLSYYARDHSDFSVYEARREAIKAGAYGLVLEDLS